MWIEWTAAREEAAAAGSPRYSSWECGVSSAGARVEERVTCTHAQPRAQAQAQRRHCRDRATGTRGGRSSCDAGWHCVRQHPLTASPRRPPVLRGDSGADQRGIAWPPHWAASQPRADARHGRCARGSPPSGWRVKRGRLAAWPPVRIAGSGLCAALACKQDARLAVAQSALSAPAAGASAVALCASALASALALSMARSQHAFALGANGVER